MIDDALAFTARRKLFELAGDHWDQIRWEIQDDGTFLLLMARIARGEPKEVAPKLREDALRMLNALIPAHPTQDAGSWLLNVSYGDALVDSIWANEL